MGKVIILPETTKNPISLMGERAGICWGADTSDPAANYKRGWDCIASGHGRVMEYVNVEMVLDGYSARVIREWYTHIGGAPSRLQASTRYIDYANFEYVTPSSIEQDENAFARYREAMGAISWALRNMPDIPREDIALLLPLGMTTKVVDKRNLRNLVDMSRQRMCKRAFWEFREMFGAIYGQLSKYSDEWNELVGEVFYPKCEILHYCPEKHGCGKYPGREG